MDGAEQVIGGHPLEWTAGATECPLQPGVNEQGVVADIEVRRTAAEPALRREHRHAPVRTQIAHGVVRVAESTRLVGVWVIVQIDEVELVASLNQRVI
ncbi:MAG: hypothetical protein ACK55I_44460, partial [bacterium]